MQNVSQKNGAREAGHENRNENAANEVKGKKEERTRRSAAVKGIASLFLDPGLVPAVPSTIARGAS
jgi:hypothetical protein